MSCIPPFRDLPMERRLADLLRAGVIAASGMVLGGALLFLVSHGAEPADYATFHGEPAELRNLGGMLHSALALDGRGVMQLGIAILIATPIARVAFSVGAFARARNARYVAITATVLTVLAYSMFGQH
jgi:uncharacterized membrane protein